MRKSDVWIFRIGAALLTFVATVFGCRHGGRYLHEKFALEKAHRERSEAQDREDAVFLSKGFNDTQGYRDMERFLTAAEMSASFAAPHPIEEHAAKIAAGAALLVALLAGESARLWATKREAQRRISGRYPRS